MRWNLVPLLLLIALVAPPSLASAEVSLVADVEPTPGAFDDAPFRVETPRAEAEPTEVGEKKSGTSFVSMARTGAALAFVITLVVLLAWAYRRVAGNRIIGGPAAAQVLARNPISPRAGVVLLKVGRRVLVCAESAGQPLTTLSEITAPDEVAELEGRFAGARGEPQQPFALSLQSASAGYESEAFPDPSDSEVAAALQHDAEDHEADATRGDLAGLMERVRTVSRQLKTTGGGA